MLKITNINKVTDLKFLNLYQVTYESENKKIKYNMASRRDQQNLECLGNSITDAVRVVPYYYDNNQINIVIIKEFRHAINSYIYSTPAGLIDGGESAVDAAKRELLEEIGASVININKMQNASYTSAGLTDETVECYSAEIILGNNQNLDGTEDIEIVVVNVNNILDFVNTHKFCMQSALLLKIFYYENIVNKKG